MEKLSGKQPQSFLRWFSSDRNSQLFLIVVALSALFWELWITSAFLSERLSPILFGVSHCAAVLILAGLSLLYHRLGIDLTVALLLLLTTMALGPIGPVGTLLTLGLVELNRLYALSFQEWYESLFPKTQETLANEVLEHLQAAEQELERGELPVPFIDVLKGGSLPEKQRVINLISNNFKPIFARTLLTALDDEANAVRVQAATTMAQIENRFLEETVRLSRVRQQHPDDLTSILRLARHYDDYAFTGLLDASREMANREKATEAYYQYLEAHPDDLEVRTAVGRLLVRSGRFEAASEWLRENLSLGANSAATLLWLVECEYCLGHWKEVRRLLREHAGKLLQADLPDTVRSAVRLWLGMPDDLLAEPEVATG